MLSAGHDVIVVGAGAVGLAVADRFLARHPGASVLICEDDSYPAGSTAAGAMIVAWSEVTAQARQQAGFEERMDEAERAVRAWREELADAEIDGRSVVTSRGLNVVLPADPPQPEIDNFAAIRQVLQERGVRWESVDVDVVAGLEPVDERQAVEALYIPEEFTVDAELLAQWQRRRLAQRGARFHRGRVTVAEREGQVVGVTAESGEVVPAADVVVAAGSASRELLPESVRVYTPPLYSGAGAAARVRFREPTAVDALRTPNRAFACGLHLLPLGGNDVYVGATNDPTLTVEANPSVSDVEYVLRSAILQVNRHLTHAKLRKVRFGSRPVPADATAMVGPVTAGLWMATGGNRDGLTHALCTADRLTAAMDGDQEALPRRWRPVRRPQSAWTAAQALAHAEANCRGMVAEPDQRLDHPLRDVNQQAALLRQLATLYEAESDRFVLPPNLAVDGRMPAAVREWVEAWESGPAAAEKSAS